jgi:isopenicillin-N N-acyltransferase like protein
MSEISKTAASPPRPRGRLKKWLKRLAWTALAGTVGIAGFVIWAVNTCFAEPPELATRPAILDAKITTDADGRTRFGRSWFAPNPGRSLLHVEGDPFTIGYCNSTLTRDLLEAQERSLIENVRTLLPGTVAFYSAALLVLVHNRNLPDYISDEYKLEIFGLSQNGSDPYPQFGNRYHRILNYHAAHDISHWVLDTPALGCTSFAATGDRTRDGHLILGRNFDWESGEHFDIHKVIARYKPTNGHTFLSVSWPGMAGVVTGLNDAKIFCAINGAHTEHMGLGVGRPVSLVAREVLQYSDNLEDATARIRAAPVFVADSFLLADGKTGRAIVVEKTPVACAVREMRGDWILQSNHFETAALTPDAGNVEYMRDGTSVPRRARLAELLARHNGHIDPTTSAAILRDRLGVGDVDRGLGHRATINPMIATHSVVADATAGVLWVSRGRHQLGIYDAYTVAEFEATDAPPIPADVALENGDYDRLTRYREIVAALEPALASGSKLTPESRRQLDAAIALNPRAPEILAWDAQALELDGKLTEALARYREAKLAYHPFRPDRQQIEAAIRRLEARTER